MYKIIFIIIISMNPLLAFPGDHNSLSCDKNFIGISVSPSITTKDNIIHNIIDDSVLQEFYRQYPGSLTATQFNNRANIVKAIETDLALVNSNVKQKIRASHDLSVDVTKFGDSLSDFVDFL